MKKTLYLVAISCLLFTFPLKSNAQEVPETTKPVRLKHALGMAAGATTGYGLSYRYNPSKWTIQTTFAPIMTDYSNRVSLGISFLYYLAENNHTSLFLYEGNHFLYNKSKNDDYYYTFPEPVEKFWNNGVGIGIEFIIFKQVSFNLMAGYGFYDNFSQLNVTGETGLYYKF